jgi:hypothetical protein
MHIQLFTIVIPNLLGNLGDQAILLLYLGPETIMPLASILGAVIGFLLVFWRLLLKPVKKFFGVVSGKNEDEAESSPSSPELQSDAQE